MKKRHFISFPKNTFSIFNFQLSIKNIFHSSLFILHFALFANVSFGQIITPQLGLNPFSTKWKQIKTDKVQVIFQKGSEKQAQRVANLVHFMCDSATVSIGENTKRVSIFLQNQTTIPNGFVSSSPFRSEFFLTPPQFSFNGSGNWLDLLGIHEYRHVQQISNATKGLTKATKFIFGNNLWGAIYSTATPRWYREGDAVLTETLLTNAGRGRTPNFDKEYKALILSGKKYNYEKASAGSIRDFVPNHYGLGYYMMTYGRRKFGNTLWKEVLFDASKFKGIFYPFSRNLKKKTGLRTPQLYKAAMSDLAAIWKAESKKLQLTSSKKINTKEKRMFTSYRNAHYFGETILVEKTGFQNIRSIYQIDKLGNEKKLLTLGNNIEINNTVSVQGSLLVWSELAYDVRWKNKNYSIVKSYNLSTKKKSKLTSKTKYFAPSISNSGTQIVVSEVLPNGENALVILDSQTGEAIKKLPNLENVFFSFPRFSDDDQTIIVIGQKNNRQGLLKVSVKTGKTENVLPYNIYQLSNPFPKGDYVYFSASYTGIDNIFAAKLTSEKSENSTVWQLTSVQFGAYQPSVATDKKHLLFNEFTVNGYDLKEIEINPSSWKKINIEQVKSSLNYYQPLVAKENGNILNKIPNNVFETKKYRQTSGLLNLHSWQPTLSPPLVGAAIVMQNKLTSLFGSAGYKYNLNERNSEFSGNIAYGGFFTQLEAEFRSNNDRAILGYYMDYKLDKNGNAIEDSLIYYSNAKRWEEKEVNIGVMLPLTLSNGSYYTSLRISSNYKFLKMSYNDRRENSISKTSDFNAMNFRVRFFNQQRTAKRNVKPRFGQFIDYSYSSTLSNAPFSGKVSRFNSILYLPGLLRTHSFYVSFAAQKQNLLDEYKFADYFSYARGYSIVGYDRINRWAFNYEFPLLHPDIALSSFVFLKRIKTNIFYDKMTAQVDSHFVSEFVNLTNPVAIAPIFKPILASTTIYRTFGTEVTFDFRLFRLLDIEMGFRYNYLLDNTLVGLPKSSTQVLLLRIGG